MPRPPRHISIRVPWHDTGWGGCVCAEPALNGACLKLKRIANERDDAAEQRVAGQSLEVLDQKDWPCCVSERVAFVLGGWSVAEGPFGLVLANPPYVAEREMAELAPELGYEPESALAAGPEGLDAYRALGPAIAAVLAPEGRAFIEIGAGQEASVGAVLASGGLEIVETAPDLSGIPRCLVARACGRPLV